MHEESLHVVPCTVTELHTGSLICEKEKNSISACAFVHILDTIFPQTPLYGTLQ